MRETTRNTIDRTAIGVLLFLTIYAGWGQELLEWLVNIPFFGRVLDPSESLLFSICLVGITVLLICYLTYQIWTRRIVIKSWYAVLLFALIYIWLTCRASDDWQFYGFSVRVHEIKYFDILALIPVSMVLCFIIRPVWQWARNRISNESQSVEAQNGNIIRAIKDSSEDLLGRKEFAIDLCNRILNLDVSSESAAVAIIAPWGSGKTSFINLMKEQFDVSSDSRHQVIDFSPWAYTSPVNVAKTFFETLISTISRQDLELSLTINRYLKVLSSTDIPTLSIVGAVFAKPHTLQSLFDKVKEGLFRSDRTYIICIDDMDRLNAQEILEVLKLIRSSANFPNLKFICAFDKQYVVNELANESSAITERFLEKFFRIDYWLPSYDLEKIRQLLLQLCEGFLSDSDLKNFDEYLRIDNRPAFGRAPHPIKDGITNLRIAYRWIESIDVSYSHLRDNVLIDNLADIELLKLIAPAFFDSLRTNWRSYVEETGHGLKLWGREKVDVGKNDEEWMRELFQEGKKNIFGINSYITLSEDSQNNVKNILSRLLPEYGGNKEKAFSNISYTERYFFNILQDNEISNEEFAEIMSRDYDSIKSVIDSPEFVKKFKWFALLLNKYVPDDFDNLTKFLKVIFYAGKKSREFMVNPHEIFKSINNYKDKASQINRTFHDIIEENRASEFSLKFFEVLEYSTTKGQYEKYTENLTSQVVALKLLRYSIEDKRPSTEISHYFWQSGEYKNDRTSANGEKFVPDPEAVMLYREFWETNFLELYPKLISHEFPHMEEDNYVLSSLVDILWDSKERILKLFDGHESDRAFMEAKEFMSEAYDSQKHIAKYEFKYLHIEN